MAIEIVMPRLSDETDEGVIVTWFVEVGAVVGEGDLVAEVQVEKVSEEVYAPASGRVRELRVGPGGTVSQGAVIAVLDEPSDAAAGVAEPLAPAVATASPAARRVARELGVDLSSITGSGPDGRIVEGDVLAAAAPPATGGEPLTPLRRVLADRLRTWQQATAQLTLTAEADVTALEAALAARRASGAGASYLEAIVRACALALRDHPRLGARWEGERVVLPGSVDVGIAVAVEDGLVAPVVRAADGLDLEALHTEIARLASRARAGELTNAEMEGGVFSVTNLGAYGVDAFTPLLNPPQTAILGVGRAAARPAVVDGAIVARTLVVLSLTIDHQVTDGAPGAAFLAAVVRLLGDPDALVAGLA